MKLDSMILVDYHEWLVCSLIDVLYLYRKKIEKKL